MYSVMPAPMSNLCVCKVPPADPTLDPNLVRHSCKDRGNLVYATSVCHEVATVFLSLVYIGIVWKTDVDPRVKKGMFLILLCVFLIVVIPTALLCADLNQPETSVCNRANGVNHAEAKDVIKAGFSTSALFVAGTSIALALIMYKLGQSE